MHLLNEKMKTLAEPDPAIGTPAGMNNYAKGYATGRKKGNAERAQLERERDELHAEVERLKIERDTFRLGHSNASNRCCELEAEVERLRAEKETRDALLRALNAVAIERGDKYGACDCIDNKGNPYPSWHLADVLAAAAPAPGTKEKA